MKPTTEHAKQKAHVDDIREQEQFVRQAADDSLPAAQVLTDQKHGREAQDPAPLFVP